MTKWNGSGDGKPTFTQPHSAQPQEWMNSQLLSLPSCGLGCSEHQGQYLKLWLPRGWGVCWPWVHCLGFPYPCHCCPLSAVFGEESSWGTVVSSPIHILPHSFTLCPCALAVSTSTTSPCTGGWSPTGSLTVIRWVPCGTTVPSCSFSLSHYWGPLRRGDYHGYGLLHVSLLDLQFHQGLWRCQGPLLFRQHWTLQSFHLLPCEGASWGYSSLQQSAAQMHLPWYHSSWWNCICFLHLNILLYPKLSLQWPFPQWQAPALSVVLGLVPAAPRAGTGAVGTAGGYWAGTLLLLALVTVTGAGGGGCDPPEYNGNQASGRPWGCSALPAGCSLLDFVDCVTIFLIFPEDFLMSL